MTQNNKEKDKILQLKKDIVFQKLFGSEENKEITSYFLSLILERNITSINLDVNKKLIGNSIDEKASFFILYNTPFIAMYYKYSHIEADFYI